jgi:hypothetical protein
VTTVKLMFIDRRPSALPAVCAPVSGVPGSLAVSAAHAIVGHAAVIGGMGAGTSQIQARGAQVEGRNASSYGLQVKDSVKVDLTFGDVRGVPPRGRPV